MKTILIVEEITMSYQLMRNLKKQGPSLAHCDSVVFEAMNNYWAERGGQWHFF